MNAIKLDDKAVSSVLGRQGVTGACIAYMQRRDGYTLDAPMCNGGQRYKKTASFQVVCTTKKDAESGLMEEFFTAFPAAFVRVRWLQIKP